MSSKLLFADVVSFVSIETMTSYAQFEDNIKCNLLVRQLYSLEFEMESIDQVLLDKEEGQEYESEYYKEEEEEDDDDADKSWVELIDGKIEKKEEEEEEEEEEEDVAVYQVDFNSYLHPNSTLTLLQFHGNDNDYFTSLITEPRFRISQSVSEKIRNRNLSLLRVNTI